MIPGEREDENKGLLLCSGSTFQDVEYGLHLAASALGETFAVEFATLPVVECESGGFRNGVFGAQYAVAGIAAGEVVVFGIGAVVFHVDQFIRINCSVKGGGEEFAARNGFGGAGAEQSSQQDAGEEFFHNAFCMGYVFSV